MGIMVTSMSVRCPQCFYENEERYRFCGMCGIALPRIGSASEPEVKATRPAAAAINSRPEPTVAPAREPVREKEREPIPVTGPSFLGLSQDQNPYPDRSLDYLLEDEPKPGRGRTYIALVLLLAAVGMLAWRWRHSGFLSQTHPAVATTPGTSTPNPQEAPPDTTATPAATPSVPESAASKAPVQAGHGTPQESDLPPGSTPSTDAAKTQPTPTDDQASTATPAGSGNSTEQAAAPPAAKPIPAQKPVPTPRAVASRDARVAAIPSQAAAPEQDPVEAQGEKYLYGSGGVPQNCGLAQRSLLESAQRANPKAQSVLGTMYATGHCVGRDLPTAYRWFAKASHEDPNNARITRDLEVLWKQMTAGERQLAVNNRE
jgi:hypothetical protein